MVNADYLNQQRQGNTTARPADNLASRLKKPNDLVYTTMPVNPARLGATSPYENHAIKGMYDSALGMRKDAINAGVEAGRLGYQRQIEQAPTTYQPLRNEAYTNDQMAQRTLRERLANMGMNATGGKSLTLENQRAMGLQNRLGDINRQQQKFIDDANFAIKELEAQGRYQEAQAVADSANSQIGTMIEDRWRNTENDWRKTEYEEDQRRYEQDRKDADTDRYYTMFLNGNLTAKQFKAKTGMTIQQAKARGGGKKKSGTPSLADVLGGLNGGTTGYTKSEQDQEKAALVTIGY
jgi:hypothetical protein